LIVLSKKIQIQNEQPYLIVTLRSMSSLPWKLK